MSFSSAIGKIFKRYFVSGILVVVPLIVTYLVLRFLFDSVDGILQPIIFKVINRNIPGLGVIATLILVIVAGLITHNYLGSKLYRLWEGMLIRVPVIRPVYSAAKSILESTTTPSAGSFQEVVIIEFPRKGVRTLGFVANRLETEFDGVIRKCATVFIPNPPTPFTGQVVIVPIDEIEELDMTIEQGLKYVVSGGVVVPELVRKRGLLKWSKPKEALNEAR